jgi:multidrug resistance efflux pump
MSVKVVRERPDQRRHHRVTAPLFVTLGTHTVRAADWSLGGLRVEAYPGPSPAVGDSVDLRLTLPFQGFDVACAAIGEIVRIDPSRGMFALKFTQLGQREEQLMRHFLEELVRGSMVDVADTIQRIDVPITPVSTAPDASPKDQVPVGRWPLKTILYSAFYLTLGLFVFGYTAVMMWSNVFRMEVQTAVITAPLVTVQAPGDGRVLWTNYKPGDAVPAGAVVLQVADNELERAIDLAEVEIREKSARRDFLRRQYTEALSELGDLATVERKNIEQDSLQLDTLKAAAELAEHQQVSVQQLFKKGYATRIQVDQARQKAIQAVNDRDRQQVEVDARAKLAGHGVGQRFFNGSGFVGDRAKLEAEIKLAQEESEIAEAKRDALLAHRVRLAVVAPYDGVIMELPRVDHAPINRGDIIAILEQPAARQVTAYLTQDEVLRVGLGDKALVYVPSFDDMVEAKITEIDRTSGFVEQMAGRYGWRGSMDRSAKVTLAFAESRTNEPTKTIRSGTPAIVLFESRSTNDVVAQVRYRFGQLVAAVAGVSGDADPALAAAPDDGQNVPTLRPSTADAVIQDDAANPLPAPAVAPSNPPALRPTLPQDSARLRGPFPSSGASRFLLSTGEGRQGASESRMVELRRGMSDGSASLVGPE